MHVGHVCVDHKVHLSLVKLPIFIGINGLEDFLAQSGNLSSVRGAEKVVEVNRVQILLVWLILHLCFNFVQKLLKFPSLNFTYNIMIGFLLDSVFVFDLILVKDEFNEIVESSTHCIYLKSLKLHSLAYPRNLIGYHLTLSLKVFLKHFLNFIIKLFFKAKRFGFSK